MDKEVDEALDEGLRQLDPQAKLAHRECLLFRALCWLPYPQPACEDCDHLNGVALLRESKGV